MSNLPARARRIGSVAHRRVAPVMGVVWYSAPEWARVKAAAADPERFEATYEEWTATAGASLAELRRAGAVPKKVDVGASALLAWCLAHDRPNDAAARAQYVSERMHAQRDADPKHGA